MVKIERIFWRFVDLILVGLLTAMFAMVLSNVVLRYFFHSGIPFSEELSRFCFVWLIFIGATRVARDGGHIAVEALVTASSPRWRRVMMIGCDLIVLACCAMFVDGTWRQLGLHATNRAPITGLSYAWVFGIGIFSGAVIGLITVMRLIRALTNRLKPGEMASFAGEYENQAAASVKRLSE